MSWVGHHRMDERVSFRNAIFLLVCALSLGGCLSRKGELGSAQNPVKLFFTPAVDAQVIEDNSIALKQHLEKVTPYHYEISVPQSYIAVVESFGTKRADVAAINTAGYLSARQKYGVTAGITVIRFGTDKYYAQFVVKNDSPIQKLTDLENKKIAFVDAGSTSGYLLPMKMLKDAGINPKEIVFAGKHDSVIMMVYQGTVDAGATFYVAPSGSASELAAGGGEIQDARRLVKTQYPDVEQKIRILQLSEGIPNDPIIFREGVPAEMKEKITAAFIDFIHTPEGKVAFDKIFGVTDLKRASDADYEPVRQMIETVGDAVDRMMKKGS